MKITLTQLEMVRSMIYEAFPSAVDIVDFDDLGAPGAAITYELKPFVDQAGGIGPAGEALSDRVQQSLADATERLGPWLRAAVDVEIDGETVRVRVGVGTEEGEADGEAEAQVDVEGGEASRPAAPGPGDPAGPEDPGSEAEGSGEATG